MNDYTQEEIKRIASEECPKCGAPMSYNRDLKGFTCDGCRLLINYGTYLKCKDKEHERVEEYMKEFISKREEAKKSNP